MTISLSQFLQLQQPVSLDENAQSEDTVERRTANAFRAMENRYVETYKALHLGGEETLESRMIRSVIGPRYDEEEIIERFSNYNKVSSYLSTLTDAQLAAQLATARRLGSGTGGEVLSMEAAGVPLFVKKIRLTEIEQQNPRSTRNLFELPYYYQYGVGSMGFGVWREVAAHEMTTTWVLQGECQHFPLMYHSRVLQRSTRPTPLTAKQFEEREQYIKYWDNSSAVRNRREATDTASADVVVFMEHFPQTLKKWFRGEAEKNTLTSQSINRVERELLRVSAFMKSRGFLHFDAHFDNIMESNNHIYFADFGLVLSQHFDLSPAERAFFEKHIDYDRYYVASVLVMQLVKNALSAVMGKKARNEIMDNYVKTGKITHALPSAVVAIEQRYKPIVHLMFQLFHGLQSISKSTPYPEAELAREWRQL